MVDLRVEVLSAPLDTMVVSVLPRPSQTLQSNDVGMLRGVGEEGIAVATDANPAVIAAAAIGGGMLGGYAGKQLDDRDKRMAREAAQQAFEGGQTGSSVAWSNPDSGNSGSVTPTRTYQLANGQYCRQYRQDIKIGNESHETTGTACRASDGLALLKRCDNYEPLAL